MLFYAVGAHRFGSVSTARQHEFGHCLAHRYHHLRTHRLEKKRVKHAKRLLKRQRRAADMALVPSAAREKPKKVKTEKNENPKKTLPEKPLTAAQAAAAKVAAARAAAMEEDAALARLGAPREELLGFRAQGLDGVFGDAEDAKVSKFLSDSKCSGRERLEELVPKASGREALLEKRAAVRLSNREMANAKEDGMFSAGGWAGNEMGGGGEDFKAALQASNRAKDARDQRRGVDANSAALRVHLHQSGEAQKMASFHDLVHGLWEGKSIQIPKRE